MMRWQFIKDVVDAEALNFVYACVYVCVCVRACARVGGLGKRLRVFYF
jgi:hypothetical protein